jgi:hypothetical protein
MVSPTTTCLVLISIADDGSGVEWRWGLTTASGHPAMEGHTQCAVVGVKQLAAGTVWQALNNGRQVAGGGTAQTTSCGRQAASGKRQAACGGGQQGANNWQPIDLLAIRWHSCCCIVGLPETAAVAVCADVLNVG